jgi:hypothetical protein
LGCELLHARCTSAWWVAVERRWLSHTALITLGHRPLPPSTTPPAPMAPHAGMEAAPAAITSPHPAHCACSSAAACQRQAGARWAALCGSALKSYDSALLQAGLLLPCATANQSWIELRATGSWKLCLSTQSAETDRQNRGFQANSELSFADPVSQVPESKKGFPQA